MSIKERLEKVRDWTAKHATHIVTAIGAGVGMLLAYKAGFGKGVDQGKRNADEEWWERGVGSDGEVPSYFTVIHSPGGETDEPRQMFVREVLSDFTNWSDEKIAEYAQSVDRVVSIGIYSSPKEQE